MERIKNAKNIKSNDLNELALKKNKVKINNLNSLINFVAKKI